MPRKPPEFLEEGCPACTYHFLYKGTADGSYVKCGSCRSVFTRDEQGRLLPYRLAVNPATGKTIRRVRPPELKDPRIRPVRPPSFGSGFGRAWDHATLELPNGTRVGGWRDYTWGSAILFEYPEHSGEWWSANVKTLDRGDGSFVSLKEDTAPYGVAVPRRE